MYSKLRRTSTIRWAQNYVANNTTLHRSESMISLCYKSISSFITDNNLPGLQQYLENKNVQIDDKDDNGTTALMLASTKGKANFVKVLLEHGADPNAEDLDQWTALLCASKEGHLDICSQLLEQNAVLEHREMGGWTALMWATYKGHTTIVQMLLERHADPNAHGNYHIPSLLWAAGRGHTQIAEALVSHGAKVNIGDKYGTSALIWAARKGHAEIVRTLLRAGANTDTAGMYSWTALLVATQGNFIDVVNLILEYRPNVNALDKDGCSALTIACKEGYYEIATSLMNAGAYINIQDRAGDTNLIHAVKGGHRGVVEALLKKYADVDVTGKDRKTALYMAVEKGYTNIVKILMNANPDLELSTKDGDTPLLKAVRSRNAEIVQLLLDKKAKVSAADKKGDTCLHIAMRARSKAIVEILLRNPKYSHLLYRPNRAGETPYNIDVNHQKTILGQIFGARRLNTNEDNENMLGYDLYSSALADILSEPSLSMPITVGLYAKWGSGKSFLLNKLREEMKNFARQYIDPTFQFSLLLFLLIVHFAMAIGTASGLATLNWMIGVGVGVAIFMFCHAMLVFIWFANKRMDWDWPYHVTTALTRKMSTLKLVLQVLFCHAPGAQHDGLTANPIRFYFTDQTRVSSTTGGENSVVQMLGSLYDAIEADYGSMATRLYRAFKPKAVKSSTTWRWRKLCCVPYIIVFELTYFFILIGACGLTVYLITDYSSESDIQVIEKMSLHVILIVTALILGIAFVANLYTWSKMFGALFFSQRRHLQRTISKLETLKSEGFLQALRLEVNLMKDMVKCLDSFSSQQTRLVIIVDGLDSSEQDKILLVLDAVHMLFSDASSPYIVILAIDPHVISKAVEQNTRRLFSESNIGGHSYLNNMVHLPFYLQNSGLRKVSVAQQTAQSRSKSNVYQTNSNDDALSVIDRSLSARRLSSENALMSSTEKLKYTARKGSRKLKMSESIASSIGSNLNRIGGAQDLTKMLLTDDYFSDVNPRSMRRLMNVIYITGRLLKAFKIDFSWYRLASWINITEQWPFRTSYIIYHFDLLSEEPIEDNTPLKNLYDKIRPNIPALKEIEPLLELDRDERKFDVFLSYHRSSLLVSDLKVFLPFTINLDPYLKKIIKEETQDEGLVMGSMNRSFIGNGWPINGGSNDWQSAKSGSGNIVHRRMRPFTGAIRSSAPPAMYSSPSPNMFGWNQPQPVHHWSDMPTQSGQSFASQMAAPITNISADILELKLATLSVDGVCKLLDSLEGVNTAALPTYKNVMKDHNINGRVLLHCDLDELKKTLQMSFGDWEMFKMVLVSLRENELTRFMQQEECGSKNFVRHRGGGSFSSSQERKGSFHKMSAKDQDIKGNTDSNSRSKQSVMEKQVTLEEQMICGALQTLNEEACEDVLDEDHPVTGANISDTEIPITLVVPPSPENNLLQQQPQPDMDLRSRTNSTTETDFLILQSSPMGNWQPIVVTQDSYSDHSSRCSTPRHSPVLEKRSNSIKMSNLKSTISESYADTADSAKKPVKHVVIRTDSTDPFKYTVSTRNNSSTVYESKLRNTDFITNTQAQQPRPISLNLSRRESFDPLRSKRTRSKSIDCARKASNTAMAMLTANNIVDKLLEKSYLHSDPQLSFDQDSNDESTPLVSSEKSTSSVQTSPMCQNKNANAAISNSSNNGSFKSVDDMDTPVGLADADGDSDSSLSLSLDSSKLLTASSNASLASRQSQVSLSRQDALDVDVSN